MAVALIFSGIYHCFVPEKKRSWRFWYKHVPKLELGNERISHTSGYKPEPSSVAFGDGFL
ncbi:MAG: hypothetical protein HW390_1318 [Candidatus Brocadiaceae bacterium]|nr:hypothetical protein [Candidatus Brocadiaceae bacterium]